MAEKYVLTEAEADRWLANLKPPKQRYVEGLRNEVFHLRDKLDARDAELRQTNAQVDTLRDQLRDVRGRLEQLLRETAAKRVLGEDPS